MAQTCVTHDVLNEAILFFILVKMTADLCRIHDGISQRNNFNDYLFISTITAKTQFLPYRRLNIDEPEYVKVLCFYDAMKSQCFRPYYYQH